jgi:outer membrane protein OmpA-like peptidoglycan-associated protein
LSKKLDYKREININMKTLKRRTTTVITGPTLLAIALCTAPYTHAATGRTTATGVNVTGTWTSNLPGSPDLNLFQEGDRVWGRDGSSQGAIRGSWIEGRLTVVYTDSVIDQVNPGCGPRWVMLLTSKGTATRLDGMGFSLQSGDSQQKYLTRQSPDPGPDFAYPYDLELQRCGQIFAWDLIFATDSDKLQGTDWPVLKAVADVLGKNQGMKIKIAGHTDSTGDAAHNQDLSARRAESVKKVMVDKYGADATRIATKGWGDEQPLVPNTTAEGRALNRRVEILLAH